ncbi:MAG: hypothetical protein HC846_12565 [Blastocatellia bacterium]|nr:hypothetical protein [Blastocatellia bacterium]
MIDGASTRRTQNGTFLPKLRPDQMLFRNLLFRRVYFRLNSVILRAESLILL